MPLALGTRLGPYDIIAPLGAGGMGEVYKARDTRLDRDVALKVLPSSLALDPDQRARFEREAKAVAALSHPNILAIFDFAVIDGVAYAATELLNGETLRARLGAGPLSIRRAVDTTVQIARGLAAAHEKGIIHRDLKPENVFLLEDGHVKILDFGLAKTVAGSSGGNHETVVATDPGVIMGTVGYMAPEQVRGQALDARADVFALGVILYEMLSGRRAFQRETAAETMTAILKEDAPDLAEVRADVPPGLEAIVRHCLERNPAERFQSARDLAFNLQVLQPAGSGPAVAVKPLGFLSGLSWHEGIAWALVVVFALGFIVRSRRAIAPSASPVVRLQVTAPEQTTWASPLGAPEGSNGGTISPDGTMIAFVAGDASGRTLLWIRPIDTFSARPVAGTDGAAFPFWSPDSRALGFFTTTKLKRIAVEGGPAQTLCELASTPRGGAWNHRGVILIGTTGSLIRRISAEGGQLTPVTGEDSQNAGQQWPYFLPDGEHFLFYSAKSRAVFVGSLESRATKRILPSDSNAIFAAGGQILFVKEGSLFAQAFDVARLEVTGEARPVVERISWAVAPWNLAAFSVSRTGTLTYRLGGGSRTQFAWFDRAGRELGTVGPPGDYLSPALSPDETHLAYTRRDDQAAGDIWTLDLARQTPMRLTFSPDTDVYPVWTPDGSAIAYSSVQDGIVAKPLAGTTQPRQLQPPTSSVVISSEITPDGRLVFFGDMGTSTGFDIYTLSLSGDAQAVAAIQGPLTDAEPDLSPDGRWMAYATTETGAFEVFVQPFPPTGAKWQVSNGGGRQPQWRRDGKELYFVTNDRKLYAVDVRPGATFDFSAPRLLFNIPANTVSVRNSYVPRKDGQQFLVNKLLDIAAPPINIVLNWAPAAGR